MMKRLRAITSILLLVTIIASSFAIFLPTTHAQTPTPPAPTTPTPAAPSATFNQKLDGISFANCGGLPDAFLCGLGWFLLLIGNLIASISGWLLNLAVMLVTFTIGLDQANGGILNQPVLKEGFKISLQTANLLFILVVILIAFMTIFRIEQYSVKKLLPRLILAVILINFGLFFAGAILDLSSALTSRFAAPVQETDWGQALRPQNLFAKGEINADDNGAFVEALLTISMNIAFTTIFTVLAMIVVFAVGVMILIRYIWIVLLLVLMPFAWLLWVTPYYTEYGKKWWEKFLQWTLFLPAVMFFIYLATTVQKNALPPPSQAPGIAGLFQNALNMIVMIGLLVGGLITAQKLGITGAKAGMDFAKALGRGVTGAKKGGLIKIAEKAGEKVRAGVARVPLLGKALNATAGGRETLKRIKEERELKRAKGPEIQEVDESAGLVVRTAQGIKRKAQQGKKWVGEKLLGAKSGKEMAEAVRRGEPGDPTLEQTRKLAGSKWKDVGDVAATGAGIAGATVAGLAIAGPVGAAIGAGLAYVVGKRKRAQRARAIHALAELQGREIKGEGGTGGELLGDKHGPVLAGPEEWSRIRRGGARRRKAEKGRQGAKDKKEQEKLLEELARMVHGEGGHEGESHGSEGGFTLPSTSGSSGGSGEKGGGH